MPGRCVRCGDRVYFVEEVRCQGEVWHSGCLRCENCKKQLDTSSFRDDHGNVYCSICYRKFQQFSGSQTRNGEILSRSGSRTEFLTPPARSFNGQPKEWISPRQSKSTGKLLDNQNYQYIKSRETSHNNNNRMDKDFKILPTATTNSSNDVKTCRVNTFKHVVHGRSIINHNRDDLRCKVPVSFKFLKPPNKSPTGSFKPQNSSGVSTKQNYCLTSSDQEQEPRRALRKAFNTTRNPTITSASGGRNNNHINSRFKADAANPDSPLLSKSNSRVVNTPLNCCQKCNKQVYQAERIRAAGGTWHVSCFTCHSCDRRLDSVRLCERAGQVFCSHCYHKNFGPRGTGYGIGANYQS